jgi:hypothetical protein
MNQTLPQAFENNSDLFGLLCTREVLKRLQTFMLKNLIRMISCTGNSRCTLNMVEEENETT